MTEKPKGTVKAVNISQEKGVPKINIESCEITEKGLMGDAHAADWHRQVSLLAEESIDTIRDKLPNIQYGAFAENLTTKGIDLVNLPIGQQIKIHNVILEVTQIGKECHKGCAIQQQTGKCVMPTDGIFTKVIRTGTVHTGDEIIILN